MYNPIDGDSVRARGDGSKGRQRSRRYPCSPTAMGDVHRPLWVLLLSCVHFLLKFISWTVLNVEQFQRFMAVIKKLGDRVEKEHDQFLRDSQRIEDRSATAVNGTVDGLTTRGGMDFETLVGGAGAGSVKPDTELNGNWEDDVWGSILASNSEVRVSFQTREKEKIGLNSVIHYRALRSPKQLLPCQCPRNLNLRRRAFRLHHVSARPLAPPDHRGHRHRKLMWEAMGYYGRAHPSRLHLSPLRHSHRRPPAP